MFDKFLLEDLKELKTGSESIYDLQYRYADIRKIIANRTKEKFNLLKLFLEYHIIDDENYKELFARVEYDFKYACLYIMGLIPNLE